MANEILQARVHIREMRRDSSLQNCHFGSKIKMAKNMRKTIRTQRLKGYRLKIVSLGQKLKWPKTCAKNRWKKHQIFDFWKSSGFYRENGITVTFSRGHFMWGKHSALFWLGILSSLRESSHLQCSKNKKLRAKVDSDGLYGRGRLLFMCSWLCKMVNLGQKLKWPKTCEKRFYKHVSVVLCKKPLEKTPNIREMIRFSKSAIFQRL